MVAASATTPDLRTPACATGSSSADAPSSPLPIAQSPLPASVLLDDLTSPHHSIASVAEKHNLSLADLLTWLELPSTREHMALRESAAYRQVRMVAAVNLSAAAHATIRILEDFNRTAPPDRDARASTDAAAQSAASSESYLRHSIHARKAAWLLSRFARILPVNEDQLQSARAVIRSTRATRVPPAPVSDAPRHEPAPMPAASASRARSDTTSATRVPPAPVSDAPRHELQPVRSAPAPTPNSVAAPIRPLTRAAQLTARAGITPDMIKVDPSPKVITDLDALFAQLTSIAGSMGIDLSDLESLGVNGSPPLAATGPPNSGSASSGESSSGERGILAAQPGEVIHRGAYP